MSDFSLTSWFSAIVKYTAIGMYRTLNATDAVETYLCRSPPRTSSPEKEYEEAEKSRIASVLFIKAIQKTAPGRQEMLARIFCDSDYNNGLRAYREYQHINRGSAYNRMYKIKDEIRRRVRHEALMRRIRPCDICLDLENFPYSISELISLAQSETA